MPDVIESLNNLETVKIEREEGVTFLILNRPEQRNAMSPQLHREMYQALEELAEDDETKVIVITGAGKAFCAGQDLKLYFRANEDNPKARARARRELARLALGETVEISEADHRDGERLLFRRRLYRRLRLRFCDRGRRGNVRPLGSELGNHPGGVVAWNVVRVLGYRDAMWYAATGETFDGKKAVGIEVRQQISAARKIAA